MKLAIAFSLLGIRGDYGEKNPQRQLYGSSLKTLVIFDELFIWIILQLVTSWFSGKALRL